MRCVARASRHVAPQVRVERCPTALPGQSRMRTSPWLCGPRQAGSERPFGVKSFALERLDLSPLSDPGQHHSPSFSMTDSCGPPQTSPRVAVQITPIQQRVFSFMLPRPSPVYDRGARPRGGGSADRLDPNAGPNVGVLDAHTTEGAVHAVRRAGRRPADACQAERGAVGAGTANRGHPNPPTRAGGSHIFGLPRPAEPGSATPN